MLTAYFYVSLWCIISKNPFVSVKSFEHNKKDYNKTDNAEMSKNAANNLIFYTSSAK